MVSPCPAPAAGRLQAIACSGQTVKSQPQQLCLVVGIFRIGILCCDPRHTAPDWQMSGYTARLGGISSLEVLEIFFDVPYFDHIVFIPKVNF